MANSERPRLPGIPRLPDGYYYQVVRADHHSVLAKVMEIGTSRRPSQYDRVVASREVGEAERPAWSVLTAEERIVAGLTAVGNEWIQKHNDNKMTEAMKPYVGAFDAAGAPL